MNPLLLPFDSVPFGQLKTSHFKPAFLQAISDARAEIDAITNNSSEPTFENTIAALDYAGMHLNRLSSLFFNLNAAETNEEIQKLAQEISPMLTEFSNDITLNEALFKRVKAVFESRSKLDLTPEEDTMLEKKYKHFSRNGANLPENEKEKLRKIDTELAKLKLTFGENVLAETNSYTLHLTREQDLEGLPDMVKEAAAQLASSRGKSGWMFTLDYPSFLPFMKYAAKRELRKELFLAFGKRGFNGDDNDNRELVIQIANLRYKRAQLLGYNSHAHFVLEERMAETTDRVLDFLEELLEKARPAALKEFDRLSDFARNLDAIEELQRWDTSYYSEKLKQELFDLDDEKLKPYFPLEQVIKGVFDVASKLFDLRFEFDPDAETYHEEVKTYRIFDREDNFTALLYADFHPRPGKRNGAWMTSYKPQFRHNGVNERPHVGIVCNFTRPTGSKPSLLTFNEVTTLFHEFGHALHGMLANTHYPGLSGTSVYWDFVELPSQILENWCYEEEALRMFAKHYETGEDLPIDMVRKIKEASNFQEGMATLRQLGFAFLDMAWHGSDPSGISDVKSIEEQAFAKTRLLPDTPETCMSTAFSHIFQGGYASGYYSYKWAEVLDADAFDSFKQNGIFDTSTAKKFKEYILSKGGTEKPMVLYKRFRGREPKLDALLKRAGLVETE